MKKEGGRRKEEEGRTTIGRCRKRPNLKFSVLLDASRASGLHLLLLLLLVILLLLLLLLLLGPSPSSSSSSPSRTSSYAWLN